MNDYDDKSVTRVFNILVNKTTSLMTKPHCLHPTLISVRRNRPLPYEQRFVDFTVTEEKIKDRCVNQRFNGLERCIQTKFPPH